MTYARRISLCLALVALFGCSSKPVPVGEVEVGPGVGAVETSAYEQTDAPVADTATASSSASSDTARYTLDGLVGQVNGKPIYARRVIEPMHEQLTQAATRYSGKAFQDYIIGVPGNTGILTERVNEMVLNALILGEAERDLKEEQLQGLALYVEERRAELLRLHGQGSVAVAQEVILEKEGKTIEEALEDYRAKIVVQRYFSEKITPRINITRRDIERFYRDHPETYNPPAKRTIRLIKVLTPDEAQAVADALASAGTDFAELADSEVNAMNYNGGMMEVEGEDMLALPALNEQLTVLKPGEHAGPFASTDGSYWFIQVESVDEFESKLLKDVQIDIEKQLFDLQFNILRARFVRQILDEGSYTPIEEMVSRLYAIVEARYKASPGSK